jgi:hypothetical protein
MKNHRIVTFAASVVSVTLLVVPISKAALTRKAGGSPVKYMTVSPEGSASSADTVIEVVSILFDRLVHPLW